MAKVRVTQQFSTTFKLTPKEYGLVDTQGFPAEKLAAARAAVGEKLNRHLRKQRKKGSTPTAEPPKISRRRNKVTYTTTFTWFIEQ